MRRVNPLLGSGTVDKRREVLISVIVRRREPGKTFDDFVEGARGHP